MVLDLAAPSDKGETLEGMLGLARNTEVHATSAAAYCRLSGIGRRRKDHGIANVEETGIPGVHRLLRRISDEVGTSSPRERSSNGWTSSARRFRFFSSEWKGDGARH